jgi:hypothetical protein
MEAKISQHKATFPLEWLGRDDSILQNSPLQNSCSGQLVHGFSRD